MRHTPRLSVTSFLLLASPALAGDSDASTGWDKVSDDDGIIVYQKDLEGLETISVRGEATLNASPADIADAMADNKTASEWMPLVEERRDLEQISKTERIEYTHVGMPWPLKDRFFVNRAKAEYLEGGVIRLSVKSVEDPAFKDEDKVLGFLHYSEFVLTPLDGGRKTHISLEVNTDPKGAIPKWLINVSQRSWPRKFFTGLKSQLAKRGKLVSQTSAH